MNIPARTLAVLAVAGLTTLTAGCGSTGHSGTKTGVTFPPATSPPITNPPATLPFTDAQLLVACRALLTGTSPDKVTESAIANGVKPADVTYFLHMAELWVNEQRVFDGAPYLQDAQHQPPCPH